jgi:2-polyprenyl-3-methyl-5-hydroxy-6-metoxy-1,4-benzoquinol methylase
MSVLTQESNASPATLELPVPFTRRPRDDSGGIFRFTPDESYATGNFSTLRERHARLQLDSVNGTNDRQDTMLGRTQWPREFFRDKLILECGCGAGADTERLLDFGATVVAVDIAGLETCQKNLAGRRGVTFVQASIDDLPFPPNSFDVVWCHRVLQHTPDPAAVLEHILTFVKPNGHAFVHSYARTWRQLCSWKYAMRPITQRMNSELLYRMVKKMVPPLYRIRNALRGFPPKILGRILFQIAYHVLPIRNYRFQPAFADLDDAEVIEYAIHDTFDALSPKHDLPLSHKVLRDIAGKHLDRSFEVERRRIITLLRTIPDPR